MRWPSKTSHPRGQPTQAPGSPARWRRWLRAQACEASICETLVSPSQARRRIEGSRQRPIASTVIYWHLHLSDFRGLPGIAGACGVLAAPLPCRIPVARINWTRVKYVSGKEKRTMTIRTIVTTAAATTYPRFHSWPSPDTLRRTSRTRKHGLRCSAPRIAIRHPSDIASRGLRTCRAACCGTRALRSRGNGISTDSSISARLLSPAPKPSESTAEARSHARPGPLHLSKLDAAATRPNPVAIIRQAERSAWRIRLDKAITPRTYLSACSRWWPSAHT